MTRFARLAAVAAVVAFYLLPNSASATIYGWPDLYFWHDGTNCMVETCEFGAGETSTIDIFMNTDDTIWLSFASVLVEFDPTGISMDNVTANTQYTPFVASSGSGWARIGNYLNRAPIPNQFIGSLELTGLRHGAELVLTSRYFNQRDYDWLGLWDPVSVTYTDPIVLGVVTPEPSTWMLLAGGCLGLVTWGRRFKRA